MANKKDKRLKTSFHRTFPLQRAPLAEYVRAVLEAGRALSFEEVRKSTSLGTVKVDAMKRYARATGLADERDNLTSLGMAVLRNDPYLEKSTSIWLLHLGTLIDRSVAPAFWGKCWDSSLLGEILDRSIVSKWVEQCDQSAEIGAKTAEEAATVFLTTYSKVECLGELGVLTKDASGYHVSHLEGMPPLGAIAWFISQQWEAQFKGQASVDFELFKRKSRVSAAFKMSPARVDEAFRGLADEGYCELFLAAPPFQILHSWGSTDEVLERIYEWD